MTLTVTLAEIPELVLMIFGSLPLPDLLSVYKVNRRWRSLVPHIHVSIRAELFRLVLIDLELHTESEYPVSLVDRQTYVSDVERRYDIRIPEQYRTILMEWPISSPPPFYHWPKTLVDHCWCDQSSVCECIPSAEKISTYSMRIRTSTLSRIYGGEIYEDREDEFSETYPLFWCPPKLYTDTHNRETLSFILAHPRSSWTDEKNTSTLQIRALPLSPYSVSEDLFVYGAVMNCTSSGYFFMVLEGPCTGRIYAWTARSQYGGFEAMSFLQWVYKERPPSPFQ